MTDQPSFRLKQHIADLDVFMATDVYKQMQLGHARLISDTQTNILLLPPETPTAISMSLKLHGQLEYLVSTQSHFEDVRAALKAELDKATESETKGTSR